MHRTQCTHEHGGCMRYWCCSENCCVVVLQYDTGSNLCKPSWFTKGMFLSVSHEASHWPFFISLTLLCTLGGHCTALETDLWCYWTALGHQGVAKSVEPGAHICRTWLTVTDQFRLTLFLHLPDASTHWDLGHTHYNTQNRHLSCIRGSWGHRVKASTSGATMCGLGN